MVGASPHLNCSLMPECRRFSPASRRWDECTHSSSSCSPALAAADGERHHDAVAGRELPVVTTDLDDLAHGLVAEDVAALYIRMAMKIDVLFE